MILQSRVNEKTAAKTRGGFIFRIRFSPPAGRARPDPPAYGRR
jgi:hypothetical protein